MLLYEGALSCLNLPHFLFLIYFFIHFFRSTPFLIFLITIHALGKVLNHHQQTHPDDDEFRIREASYCSNLQTTTMVFSSTFIANYTTYGLNWGHLKYLYQAHRRVAHNFICSVGPNGFPLHQTWIVFGKHFFWCILGRWIHFWQWKYSILKGLP